MPKVVLDTNIVVSALAFGGKPGQVIDLALQKKITLYTTETLIAELAETLRHKLDFTEDRVLEALTLYKDIAILAFPKRKVRLIKKDLSDNEVLACAQAAEANYIISGDKRHILPLKKFGKTRVMSLTQFLESQELSS